MEPPEDPVAVVEIMGADVAKALAHPVRRRALSALAMEELSPAALARRFGVSVGTMSYHVHRLAAAGLVTQTRQERRRGTLERFFRAAGPTHISDAVWSELPAQLQDDLSSAWLADLGADLGDAARAGTLSAPDGRLHRTRLHLSPDAQAALGREVDRLYALARSLASAVPDSSTKPMLLATILISMPAAPASGSARPVPDASR